MWLPNRTHTYHSMGHRQVSVLRHLYSVRVAYRSVLALLCFIFFFFLFLIKNVIYHCYTQSGKQYLLNLRNNNVVWFSSGPNKLLYLVFQFNTWFYCLQSQQVFNSYLLGATKHQMHTLCHACAKCWEYKMNKTQPQALRNTQPNREK